MRNKIKVVGIDMMCFSVDAVTLEPLACGCYDPYALSDPEPGYSETIGVNEWQVRRDALWRRQQSASKPFC